MIIKEVKDLIHEILASDISEFELEHTGTKLRLRRGFHSEPVHQVVGPVVMHAGSPAAIAAARTEPPPQVASPAEADEENGLHIITSPIVGTFYRAASPSAEPYVKIGDVVEEGKTLCIVEAMKLMNEIPSDLAGEIVKVYVENGHPVEFGLKLFGIRPRK
jgi:acetyl-CoA carboxylase biotin carboxyl carrier protein